MNTQQIDRITSHGIQTIYNLPTHPRVGIKDFLSDGIAVAANGTIYLDTWPNGYANKTALIEIRPGGIVRVLGLTATPAGARPTRMVATTVFVRALITGTVSGPSLVP